MSTLQAADKAEREPEESIKDHINEILAVFSGNQDELIAILQQVQQKFGYLPEQAMHLIAQFLDLPDCTVFGVATFYSQFKLKPTGRNVVKVCRGTACHVRGGARILRDVRRRLGIKPGESTPDLEYCLETVACIGACALAPTMTINDTTYGQMTVKKSAEILQSRDEGSSDGQKRK